MAGGLWCACWSETAEGPGTNASLQWDGVQTGTASDAAHPVEGRRAGCQLGRARQAGPSLPATTLLSEQNKTPQTCLRAHRGGLAMGS